MSRAATQVARTNPFAPTDRDGATAAAVRAPALAETNINPATGLATDYLNHFNEAIMLLEMLAEAPHSRDDFFAWQPRSYSEHFAASNFKHRDVAISAYETTDPVLRERLDRLANSMNGILLATREVMRQPLSGASAGGIANLALCWIKPMVARAGAVINGTDNSHGADQGLPQTAAGASTAR